MGKERKELLNQLSKRKFIHHSRKSFFHGRFYEDDHSPSEPDVSWKCDWKPRTDSECDDDKSWLTASEFTDQEQVLHEKVKHLANLLKLSNKTIIYSGAGISTAAGIAPAARSSSNSFTNDLTTDAKPTLTHRALASLRGAGLVSDWVQQNHDGLPQKAGYPQEDVIEVHGSWYDPANPVICYDGTLRRDVFSRMKQAKYSADLVLVIGTSLSGLNCDSVALEAANKSLLGDALGCVIINLQQTEKDGASTLRIFSDTDQLFKLLIEELSLSIDETVLWQEIPTEIRITVPYNRSGIKSQRLKTVLDMSPGKEIRLNPGHNCQGSRQPSLRHVFGNTAQEFQVVCRPPGPGRGTVKGYLPALYAWEIEIEGVTLLLGGWWLKTAKTGAMEMIPVINIDPQMGFLGEDGEWVWDDMETAMAICREEELEHKHKMIKMQIDEDNAVLNAQDKLKDIEDETDEIEEIMKKALANMQKTQELVNSISGIR